MNDKADEHVDQKTGQTARKRGLLSSPLCALTALLLTFSPPSIADDSDIFFNTITTACIAGAPNVLFIIDASTSMEEYDGTSEMRITRMQMALKQFISSLQNANVGVATLTNEEAIDEGKMLFMEVTDLDATSSGQTYRERLLDAVDNIEVVEDTPLVPSLYEALLYFKGDSSTHGLPQFHSPNRYTSPINSTNFEQNHVVLLSDGEANTNDYISTIEKYLGGSCSSSSDSDERCGIEIASRLFNSDLNSTIPDVQNVTVHTIGFNNHDDFLVDVATAGGGQYYQASNSADLFDVFNNIYQDILQSVEHDLVYTMGVSVNTFFPLELDEEIYFNIFRPEVAPNWSGNLKKFKVDANGVIRDATNTAAIDAETGFFKETSRSVWSSGVDGNMVELGGTGENLPSYSSRKIYSDLSNNALLSHVGNAFTTSNPSLSAILTNADHIKWARGQDVKDEDADGSTNDMRFPLNDSLHTKPFIVNYGGTATNPDRVIFYTDNGGFLHAIADSDGKEIFSFIPRSLISNIPTLFNNDTSTPHPIGLDGPMNVWVDDVNADHIIDTATDKVIVYLTMRRGGQEMYAIDATNLDHPKVLWKITGGTGQFQKLGQTWSKPVKTQIRMKQSGNVEDIDVLIFSGGYDTQQDDLSNNSSDTMGNALYIVNALDGSLIWSGSNSSGHTKSFSDMDYSIPAGVRAVDTTANGYVNQIYTADTGGQVWRFDVKLNADSASDLVDGGVIANLANGGINRRHFFHAPDVSLISHNARRKLAISVGSGFQPSPNNTQIQDRFFVIFSEDVLGKPDAYSAISVGDLYNATNNNIATAPTPSAREAARNALERKSGWFINLPVSGEKSLATSYTYNENVYFTTYSPPSSASDPCEFPYGQARLYALNIKDATAANTFANHPNTEFHGRTIQLNNSFVPGEPVIFKLPNTASGGSSSGSAVCVGTHCEKLTPPAPINPTFWINN